MSSLAKDGAPAKDGIPPWTEWQTGVETLPSPQLLLRAAVVYLKREVSRDCIIIQDIHSSTATDRDFVRVDNKYSFCDELLGKMRLWLIFPVAVHFYQSWEMFWKKKHISAQLHRLKNID